MRIRIDNRLRPLDAPEQFIKLARAETTHFNPEYAKKRGLGLWVGDIPSKICTWRFEGDEFSLPRGKTVLSRTIARQLGLEIQWLDERVSAPVRWPDCLAIPRDYQERGIAECCRREQGIVRAPTGCLAASSQVHVKRGDRDAVLSIAELVYMFNGGETDSGVKWLLNIPTYVRCRADDGYLKLTRLVAGYVSGERLTYTISFEGGFQLRATADHRFLTESGWRPLSELKRGIGVWVESGWMQSFPCGCELPTTTLAQVTSIVPHGLEPTYDLACEAPNNFVANGVVVHNSGKTLMALASLPRLGQRSLVIVRDRNLLEQWVQRAEENFKLRPKDVGIVASGKKRIGDCLTIALQQSLYSKKFPLADFAKQFGAVIVDEVHDAAARTVNQTVDVFPARVRLGFSADHCVVRGSLILMADGTQKPVEQVRAGEFVQTPLGPRVVLEAWYKGICRTGVVRSSASHLRATFTTRFVQGATWVYLDQAQTVWRVSDERAQLCCLSSADEAGLPARESCGVQAEVGGSLVRCMQQAVGTSKQECVAYELRSQATCDQARTSCVCGVWPLDECSLQGRLPHSLRAKEGAIEDIVVQRSYEGDSPVVEEDVGEGFSLLAWTQMSVGDGDDKEASHAGIQGEESCYCSSSICSGVETAGLGRQQVGERPGDTPRRDQSVGSSQGARLRVSGCRCDGVGEAEPLQAGSGQQEVLDRSRDRRQQSQPDEGCGLSQGPTVESPGVDCLAVSEQLRRGLFENGGHECVDVEVVADGISAAVFDLEVEDASCYYANGFLVHNSRRDRKEFLVEDLFGDVIFTVGKESLETTGAVVPVVVRLVPTEFQADWYLNAPSEERDFTRLVSEMVDDETRCRLVRRVVQELVQTDAVPVLVFTHRREHAQRLAEEELPADGIPAGLLLGSTGNAELFKESKTLLLSGVLKVAVGTFKAVGQGIDIPNVMSGVCSTPIGANRQFFGQVRGRICRVVPGKKVGYLYYLWDRHVFPEAARNLCSWNDGQVEVFDDKRQGWVPYR